MLFLPFALVFYIEKFKVKVKKGKTGDPLELVNKDCSQASGMARSGSTCLEY